MRDRGTTGDGGLRLTLLLSGLRWRAGSSAATLAVATAASALGAFGLIYLHSADQTVLDGTLTPAPPAALGLTLEAAGGHAAAGRLAATAAAVPGGSRWFGRPITTTEGGLVVTADGQPYQLGLVARSGSCAHLDVVAGRCGGPAGGVVLSTRSARALGLRIGQSFRAAVSGSERAASLTVAGLYRPSAALGAFWWGTNYFGFGNGPPAKPLLDDAFTGAGTVRAAVPASLLSSMVQVPFTARTLPVDTVGTLRAALRRYASAAGRTGVTASTQIGRYLDRAAATEHAAGAVILVVDLELVLLAVLALYFVTARTAAERAPDLRLALLRGIGTRSALGTALAEPVALVVVAVPIGLLVAWVAADAAAGQLFGAGVGASVTLLAVLAALAGAGCGLAAVVVGHGRVVTDSELDISDRPAQRSRTGRTVVDTVVVAVALAALAELTLVGVSTPTGATRTDPLSALAPGLSALALGVLGARLLPAGLRALRRGRAPRRVPWTLATLRVARQPEFAGQVVVVALAAGLAVFGVTGWAVSARNHDVQDAFAVGAARVLTVSVRPGVDLLTAVRSIDPHGRFAMAAVEEQAPDGTTLAVDASRLAAVAAWPPGLGAGGVRTVARQLVPAGLAPPVPVTGTALRVDMDATLPAGPTPVLAADLFDESYQTVQHVDLGPLRPGPATYQASLQGLCPSVCRLLDLAVTSTAGPGGSAPATAAVAVTSLAASSGGTWRTLAAGLGQPGRWSNPSGGARLETAAGALQATVHLDPDGAAVTLAPADTPDPLPAVLGSTAATIDTGPGGPASVVGLDGATVAARTVGEVAGLPRVGASGVLVDLDMADRLLSGPFSDTTTEVWLSDAAPPDVGRLLARAGVSVVGIDSVAARQAASVHGGVQLAYELFLVAGAAAGTLGVAVTGFAVVVGARRRRAELAALGHVGISRRSLRRSLVAEQVLAAGSGLVLGVAAGLAAAALALGSVPEFVSLPPGPPLELGLPPGLEAVVAGGLALALGLAAWAGAGRGVTDRPRGRRREAT